MKQKLISFLLFIFLVTAFQKGVCQSNEKQFVSDDEIYNFFNSFIDADSSSKTFYLSSQPGNYSIVKDTGEIFKDTIFSKQDIEAFKTQLTDRENFYWTEGKIHYSKIIESRAINKIFRRCPKKGWKKFHRKFENSPGFQVYSIPIFSADKTKCIVYSSDYCGSLCGSGSVILYIKENGKWEFVKTYSNWIS